MVRAARVQQHRVTSCEEVGPCACDSGDGRFFRDGPDRDREVVHVVTHADKVEEGRDEDEGAAGRGGAEERRDECGGEVFEARVWVGGRGGGIEAGECLFC